LTFTKTKTYSKILLLSWVYSFIALLASFFFEYTHEIHPCIFCLLQKLTLLGIFLASTCCLFFYGNFCTDIFLKISLILCFIFASAHLAIQMDLIRDICSVPKKINSLEAFQELLYTNKNNSECATITWNILGLPASAFNAIFSLSAFMLAITSEKQKKRPVKQINDFV
jgi:disulfide bond formation protein DsbB